MALHVHEAGVYSLLVDWGRWRSRSYGVAIGGAADRASLALGNALVGNPPDAVGLELALGGPTLEASDCHAGVVCGAAFEIRINDRPYPANKTFNLRTGDVLTIRAAPRRMRAYLCVPGGFVSPVFLGSRSAITPIRRGQTLGCGSGHMRERSIRVEEIFPEDGEVLRVLPGSDWPRFSAEAIAEEAYEVLPESNRMGVRLRGESPTLARLESGSPEEALSEPVCPGTIQVPRDGQPIVLGVDAQTIGGYPRAGHVIEADWDRLGQVRPGRRVRFAWVTPEEAFALRQEREIWLREWVICLQNSLY